MPGGTQLMVAAEGVPGGGPHRRIGCDLGANRGLGTVETDEIRVPDKMVGHIIGRGGQQIIRLQRDSGATIQMAEVSDGLPDRKFTVSGARDAINFAKEMIMEIVSCGDVIGGGGGGSMVEISIPGHKIGRIIGKGGETIKNLQKKSGAKMVIINKGAQQENEKPLRITGEPHEVEKAKKMVCKLIAEKKFQTAKVGFGDIGDRKGDRRDEYGEDNQELFRVDLGVGRGVGLDVGRGVELDVELGVGQGVDRGGSEGPGGIRREPGRPLGLGGIVDGPIGGGGGFNLNEKVTSFFKVPANKCGLVIGKGGESIRNINQQTGAHCNLDRSPYNNPIEKVFKIRGTIKQIDDAEKKIAEKAGMCSIHSSSLQKGAAIHQEKKIMKNCRGYLVPAERDGVPSAALYINRSNCLIEIQTLIYANYYENGNLKSFYNLQTRLSVQFDMVYNGNERCLESTYIWVGGRPSKKRLQGYAALRYGSQVFEERRKRRIIQKQEIQQYIYRRQMSRLDIMLKRYLKKIPINYNPEMLNFKLLRRKSWYKNKMMKKKLKFKNFVLGLKQNHVNSCKKYKKRKTRGIKPFITSSNAFLDNIPRSSSEIKNKMKTNELNKEACKCLLNNFIDSNKKLNCKKRKKIKRKMMQCPAGSTCLLVNSYRPNLKIFDPSIEFWTNKSYMKLDKKIQESFFQKEYKTLFKLTENVIRVKKNSSEIKQLIWTQSEDALNEDCGAAVLPACMKNMKRILIENDISLKHLQGNPLRVWNYQIPTEPIKSLHLSVTCGIKPILENKCNKSGNKSSKKDKLYSKNNNDQGISSTSIFQESSKESELCQTKDDIDKPKKCFRFPVPLKPILKKKCNKSGKKSSKKNK